MDFTPTAEILKVEVDEVFPRMVRAICRESERPRREVVSTINAIQDQMGIYAEVAALIAGRRWDVDMDSFYDEIEGLIRRRRSSSGA